MSIKRRLIRKSSMSAFAALQRMGAILAAGKGTQKDVETYNRLLAANLLDRAEAVIAKAEQTRSWEHMVGCYKQATEIYVLASVLYEKYPNYTIMSDAAFDYLARFLLKHKKELDPEFMEWYTLTAMDLKAGTGSNVTMQAPVLRMLDEHLRRRGHADKPRLLRRPAKSGKPKPSGGAGKPVRRLVRKAK